MFELTTLLILVPLLPLLGFVVLGLMPIRSRTAIAAIASGSVGLAFLITLLIVVTGSQGEVGPYNWSSFAGGNLGFGLLADNLSLTMLLVITGVGCLIHIYSAGYMADDDAYRRFFAYLNLFVAAMALLVSADGYLLLLIGWATVGLASFLLIGHYFTRPSAVAAARKALVVNTIGDVAIMLAIFILLVTFGTVQFEPLFGLVNGGVGLGLVGLLLFLAAATKSAQLPLYVWLPDAMEGPTPVSALIHAATMVTAGVYLLVRSYPLLPLNSVVLTTVAWVGAITAIFAATIALVQTDLKRVLAYSTISQLGYMFLAIGVGANGAAMFHLVTHAFFKACLFLAAGIVIHELGGEQDMRRMGGLRRKMPFAAGAFLIGTLAIAGIPPLSGFFSKDEIITAALYANPGLPLLWLIGLTTSFLTAFYMFRAYMLTFTGPQFIPSPVEGEGRVGVSSPAPVSHAEVGQHDAHASHHSGPNMTVPVAILAVLSVVGGFIGIPHIEGLPVPNFFAEWLHPVFEQHEYGGVEHGFDLLTALLATGAGVGGIGLAIFIFSTRAGEQRKFSQPGALERVIGREWMVQDALRIIVAVPLQAAGHFLYSVYERVVMEWLVGGVRGLFGGFSWLLGRGETGLLRNYALVVVVGVIVIVAYVLAAASGLV